MEEWQLRLAHERAVRDAHIKANNIPEQQNPDPEGGIRLYIVRKFNGAVFWKAMQASNHTSCEFNLCFCKEQS